MGLAKQHVSQPAKIGSTDPLDTFGSSLGIMREIVDMLLKYARRCPSLLAKLVQISPIPRVDEWRLYLYYSYGL